MAKAADVKPALIGILPLDFKNLGMGVHKEFDTLADLVKEKKDSHCPKLCACHAVYRLSLQDLFNLKVS